MFLNIFSLLDPPIVRPTPGVLDVTHISEDGFNALVRVSVISVLVIIFGFFLYLYEVNTIVRNNLALKNKKGTKPTTVTVLSIMKRLLGHKENEGLNSLQIINAKSSSRWALGIPVLTWLSSPENNSKLSNFLVQLSTLDNQPVSGINNINDLSLYARDLLSAYVALFIDDKCTGIVTKNVTLEELEMILTSTKILTTERMLLVLYTYIVSGQQRPVTERKTWVRGFLSEKWDSLFRPDEFIRAPDEFIKAHEHKLSTTVEISELTVEGQAVMAFLLKSEGDWKDSISRQKEGERFVMWKQLSYGEIVNKMINYATSTFNWIKICTISTFTKIPVLILSTLFSPGTLSAIFTGCVLAAIKCDEFDFLIKGIFKYFSVIIKMFLVFRMFRIFRITILPMFRTFLSSKNSESDESNDEPDSTDSDYPQGYLENFLRPNSDIDELEYSINRSTFVDFFLLTGFTASFGVLIIRVMNNLIHENPALAVLMVIILLALRSTFGLDDTPAATTAPIPQQQQALPTITNNTVGNGNE